MPDFSRPAEAEMETQLEMRIECERVQQLRELIFKAGVRLPQTMALPFNGGQERTLLRFTRARADTEKSFAMLRLTLKWRELKNVDYCLREPLSGFFFWALAQIPGFYIGYGKNGKPIFLEHTAVVPWEELVETIGTESFIHAQTQCLEWQCIEVHQDAGRRLGRPVTQGINIWDLNGLALSAFTKKISEILKASARIAQDFYPESLDAAYIVNAPAAFSIIWTVVKQFLHPRTASKVHNLGCGKRMFKSLNEVLGKDCYITQNMLRCQRSDIGKAAVDIGAQSALSVSQSWIQRQFTVGVLVRERTSCTSSEVSTIRCETAQLKNRRVGKIYEKYQNSDIPSVLTRQRNQQVARIPVVRCKPSSDTSKTLLRKQGKVERIRTRIERISGMTKHSCNHCTCIGLLF